MMRSRASVALGLGCAAVVLVLALFSILSARKVREGPSHSVLDPESFHHYFVQFSSDEKAMLGESAPLQWEWFEQNIPWLDVHDDRGRPPLLSCTLENPRWDAGRSHCILARSEQPGRNQKGSRRDGAAGAFEMSVGKGVRAADSGRLG